MLNGSGIRLINIAEASSQSASATAPASTVTNARRSRRQDHHPSGKLGGPVLTRHLGQSIMIGEAVEVQVVGLQGGKIRLKVIVPREIVVHRREVFDAIQAEAGPPNPSAPQ